MNDVPVVRVAPGQSGFVDGFIQHPRAKAKPVPPEQAKGASMPRGVYDRSKAKKRGEAKVAPPLTAPTVKRGRKPRAAAAPLGSTLHSGAGVGVTINAGSNNLTVTMEGAVTVIRIEPA